MSSDDLCFHPCNACGHVHPGQLLAYRCSCGCADRHSEDGNE